jgi:hypothetical protein
MLDINPRTLATKEEVETVQQELTAGVKYHPAKLGELRRKFFTREYPKVKTCGHQFVPGNQPRTNCPDCWHAYFVDSEKLLKDTLEVLHKVGEEGGMIALTNINGKKWVKHFQRFIAFLVAYQANAQAAQAVVAESDAEAA